MYCPKCGQERISPEVNYCSRCGFLLTGTMELLANDGVSLTAPSRSKLPSKRSRGLKQGLFTLLLFFLIGPLLGIITVAVNAEPYIVGIAAILLIFGGLLRMAYALMFESSDPIVANAATLPAAFTAPSINEPTFNAALPPQRQMPADEYVSPRAGQWRETNDLTPASVTDSTTKLLGSDEPHQ